MNAIASQIVSKLLVRTPVRLAALSWDIPKKIENNAELIWPESNIAEMRVLIENFKETTQALGLQYQNMKDANIHLEERVQERTTELRESEETIHLMLDSMVEAIYGIDMDGECTFCNNTCLHLLGYKHPDELLGKNMHWQIHSKRPDAGLRSVESVGRFRRHAGHACP